MKKEATLEKSIKYVVLFDMIFVLLLVFSGLLGAVLSEVLYYAAFAVPLLLFFFLCPIGTQKPSLAPKPRALLASLPLIMPTVLVTALLSWLFSYLRGLITTPEPEVLSGGIFGLLILHALLPAVLEEMLFRYVPIALIAPFSKKSAIFLSALLFAFSHGDIAQIPYAFVAGAVFAAVDIATGSVLPSVLLHLLNNTASTLLQWDGAPSELHLAVLITVGVLALASAVVIAVYQREYAAVARTLFVRGEKITITAEVIIFILLMLFVAISALI